MAEPRELLLRLLDPDTRADPYPVYAGIRERGALEIPDAHLVVFSDYASCDEVLRHPDSASDRLTSTVAQRAIAAGQTPRPLGEPGFLFLDAPDHTRLRKLAQKAYSRTAAYDAAISNWFADAIGETTPAYRAVGGNIDPIPMAVLVNRDTASAAEILAGALQAVNDVPVVGTRSFGKGVFQQVINLESGGALDLTVGEFFTADGVSLAGKGLKPDVRVPLPPRAKSDLQLNEAFDVVSGEVDESDQDGDS